MKILIDFDRLVADKLMIRKIEETMIWCAFQSCTPEFLISQSWFTKTWRLLDRLIFRILEEIISNILLDKLFVVRLYSKKDIKNRKDLAKTLNLYETDLSEIRSGDREISGK